MMKLDITTKMITTPTLAFPPPFSQPLSSQGLIVTTLCCQGTVEMQLFLKYSVHFMLLRYCKDT